MRVNFYLSAAIFCLFQVVSADDSVDRKPLAIQSYFDMGQVVSGSNLKLENDKPGAIQSELLQRSAITLMQEVEIQKRLDFKLGVGGLFWYPWPQLKASPYTRNVKFGPGISRADGLFKFGDVEKPSMSLQFGYWAYKYNPDAMNLGEYLFRSTAYPSIVYNSGWSWWLMNAANNKTTGVRLGFSHLDGAFTHDLGLFMESNVFPFNSISPAWIGTFRFGKTVEVGAGAVWQHLIAMRPSELQPKDPLTTYSKVADFPVIVADTDTVSLNGKANQIVLKYRNHGGGPIEGSEEELTAMKDADGNQPYLAYRSNDAADTTTHYVSELNPILPANSHYVYARSKEYLTFRGIKVMGRVAVDLKPLFGLEGRLGPKDLRVFAEAAVLGVQNQPIYYNDITKRIPIMVGLNLPTFKLLDILSLQMEYFPMEYQDSEEESYFFNIPAPKVPSSHVRYQDHYDASDHHLKWSVYAKRGLFQSLDLYLQVASDHMRLEEYSVDRNWEPVINRPSEWYYLFRLEFSI